MVLIPRDEERIARERRYWWPHEGKPIKVEEEPSEIDFAVTYHFEGFGDGGAMGRGPSPWSHGPGRGRRSFS